MTTVLERPSPTPRVSFTSPVAAPRATVVGGLFRAVDGPIKVMRALRAAGNSSDIVGLAIPLPGDPSDPETLDNLTPPRKQGFDVLGYVLTVVDPHRPPPDYATLIRGQNSPLTRFFLGDLATWLVGIKSFRIPSILTGSLHDPGAGGVWVLGRSNHAAIVAGAGGGERGGAIGVLASFGLDDKDEALISAYAQRIIGGECLLTTCETDAGRAKRDARLLRKHGAADLFERPIISPRREQP
ncbi:MAG: hypothetical protein ACRDJN_00935 [Chloroflexota bacterium]